MEVVMTVRRFKNYFKKVWLGINLPNSMLSLQIKRVFVCLQTPLCSASEGQIHQDVPLPQSQHDAKNQSIYEQKGTCNLRFLGFQKFHQGAHPELPQPWLSMYRHFRHTDQASPLQPSNHACNTSNVHWQNCIKHQAQQPSEIVAGGGIIHAKCTNSAGNRESKSPPSQLGALIASNCIGFQPTALSPPASLPEIEMQALLFEDPSGRSLSFYFPLTDLDAP